jgi:hypothetical protein
LGFLKLNAKSLAKLAIVMLPSEPQQFDTACIGREKALADFDGGGLTGAIRPEQSEAFARGNREVEAVHGTNVAVKFAQALNEECGRRIRGGGGGHTG